MSVVVTYIFTAIAVLASVLACAGSASAQSGSSGPAPGCNRVDDAVWPALGSDEPMFSEAMDFARALMAHGFVIECVAPSKMIETFEGQTGAALYKTNHGGFEVLFLPRSENFDLLQVMERQADGRYFYSFAGRPKPWRANLVDSPRPVFYMKSRNRLIVAFDEQLAARLYAVIQAR